MDVQQGMGIIFYLCLTHTIVLLPVFEPLDRKASVTVYRAAAHLIYGSRAVPI